MTSAARQQGLDVAARLLGDLARLDEPLGALTTYRSGGRAAILVEVNEEGELALVSEAVRMSRLHVLVLGKGVESVDLGSWISRHGRLPRSGL